MYEFQVVFRNEGQESSVIVKADSVSINSGVATFHGDDGHFVGLFTSYHYILRGDKVEADFPDADTLAVPPIDENDWGKLPFGPAEIGLRSFIVNPEVGLVCRMRVKGNDSVHPAEVRGFNERTISLSINGDRVADFPIDEIVLLSEHDVTGLTST